MSVNARLQAAERHFGQSAETLSLVLNLRQRKTHLGRTSADSQWLTEEKEPRLGFTTKTVDHAFGMGLLSVATADANDRPLEAFLTEEGRRLAGEVLAWLKAVAMWSSIGASGPGPQPRFYPQDVIERVTKEARLSEVARMQVLDDVVSDPAPTPTNIYDTDSIIEAAYGERERTMPERSPATKDLLWDLEQFAISAVPWPRDIIGDARKLTVLEALPAVLEQITDEGLLEDGYTKADLMEQLRAGFARQGAPFDDLRSDQQRSILRQAKERLFGITPSEDEDWGCQRKLFFPAAPRFGKTLEQAERVKAAIDLLPAGERARIFVGTEAHKKALEDALGPERLARVDFKVMFDKGRE